MLRLTKRTTVKACHVWSGQVKISINREGEKNELINTGETLHFDMNWHFAEHVVYFLSNHSRQSVGLIESEATVNINKDRSTVRIGQVSIYPINSPPEFTKDNRSLIEKG